MEQDNPPPRRQTARKSASYRRNIHDQIDNIERNQRRIEDKIDEMDETISTIQAAVLELVDIFIDMKRIRSRTKFSSKQ